MMKHRFLACLWTVLCLVCGVTAASAQDRQPVPVTVSQSKVLMDGKTYYRHIVLERQTIYGITKAYGVTDKELYDANPSLRLQGLRAGTVIYVPAKDLMQEEASASTAEPKRYIEHTVKWFEDLYDVAASYGVSPEQIMEANGLKSSRISKRQILLIPVGETVAEEQAAGQPRTDTPVVTKPETEPVTQPVPLPEIPVLTDPILTDTLVADAGPFDPLKVDTPAVDRMERRQEEEDKENILDWLIGKGTADFALILPFNAAGQPSETNMDFYSGVLMAVRDMEADGVKIKLNVYDFQDGLPSAFELGQNDFILGPVSPQDLAAVLDRTGGHVPVISPLDQRAAGLAENREGFIQAPATAASQYADLAAWAAEEAGNGDRIILVTENAPSGDTAPAIGVRDALLSAEIPFEEVNWTVAEGRSLPSGLTAQMTENGVNRIIVASENETFTGDLVRNLGLLLGKGYETVLYAPSRVRTFDSVDGSAYHQNRLHICSGYFADYGSPEVQAFVRSYRALFRTEPSQFALQGYDLTRYFAGLNAKYGNRWIRALDRVPSSGLHTDFRFVETGNGSWCNTGIRRIVYNTNYTTELIRK
jgi:ABC-type branched-subunit amino acid transport system substrate-binding protein/LysM repeat protein